MVLKKGCKQTKVMMDWKMREWQSNKQKFENKIKSNLISSAYWEDLLS